MQTRNKENTSHTNVSHTHKGVTEAIVHIDATKPCTSNQLSVTLKNEYEKRVVDYINADTSLTEQKERSSNDETYKLSGVKRTQNRRNFGEHRHNQQESTDEDGYQKVTRKQRTRLILMSRINENCSEQSVIRTIVSHAKENGVQLISVTVLR